MFELAYALGPVKPHVRAAAELVGPLFKVGSIGGVASRSYTSDHPLGLALDFMVGGDKAKGDAVAAYVKANASQLNVTYIIWYQKIWSVDRSSEGWRAMEDRGSATANHFDHVHVSFLAVGAKPFSGSLVTPAVGIPIPGGSGVLSGAGNALEVASWLATPANWLRIALIVSGAVALLFAVTRMGMALDAPVKAVRKVTTNVR